MVAHLYIKHGSEFPYDGRAPQDWSHLAALGVLADLEDRRGIKWELEKVEEDVRPDIVDSLAEIIRQAAKMGNPPVKESLTAQPESEV